MKRLFYATRNLDDAEQISDEVHSLGVDDEHLYVLSNDKEGIRSNHLHGSCDIDSTEILSAKKRAPFFALIPLVLIGLALWLGVPYLRENILLYIAMCAAIYSVANFLASVACNSFDRYFADVFRDHIDSGEAIIVIDVDAKQADEVEKQLKKHPLASYIADSWNIASPIPD